jgi:hypothetical protein
MDSESSDIYMLYVIKQSTIFCTVDTQKVNLRPLWETL